METKQTRLKITNTTKIKTDNQTETNSTVMEIQTKTTIENKQSKLNKTNMNEHTNKEETDENKKRTATQRIWSFIQPVIMLCTTMTIMMVIAIPFVACIVCIENAYKERHRHEQAMDTERIERNKNDYYRGSIRNEILDRQGQYEPEPEEDLMQLNHTHEGNTSTDEDGYTKLFNGNEMMTHQTSQCNGTKMNHMTQAAIKDNKWTYATFSK